MQIFRIFSVVLAILPIIMSQDEGAGDAAPEVAPPAAEPTPEVAPPVMPEVPSPVAAEATPDTPEMPPAPAAAPNGPAVVEDDLSGRSDLKMPSNMPMKGRDATPWVCYQNVQPGPCRGYFKKWYYNRKTAMCKQFIYGGCRGNSNSFLTKKECEQFCRAKGRDVLQIWARSYWGNSE
ncbi:unnamed protein product [Orchesella dallaii]|uniref:BPTI/Kunitz inhibitor domain-containing protein n=1 Tax=Orchesella dallaii TaxID=48710 RepID=A0ABP1QPA2_9HEXA